MSKKCIQCGQINPIKAKFCDNCSKAFLQSGTVIETKTITIGGDPDNDIVLDYPMISKKHAYIEISGSSVKIVDRDSKNGTAVNNPFNKIKESPLNSNDIVYLGSFDIRADRLLNKRPDKKPEVEKSTTLNIRPGSMILGRDPNCDQVLDYAMISWQHARLTCENDTILVEDLGSTNGTFVNGERIFSPVKIKVGDVIGLGSYTFKLTSPKTIAKRDYRGNVTIEARNITFSVPDKKLLDDVSLTIYPSEMVALMGPSGAGKSTLLMTLNGYTPPTDGSVLFNQQDLYTNYAQFCGHLGYVPQNDIMHGDLTVAQALYYTAKLRLPSDYSEEDIKKRVDQVLNQLSLENVGNVLIGSPEKKGISGGQRKRVNLAMELLTDPSVLFLDEPTSGLSSEDTLTVLKVLRTLADAGKTILITIHQPSVDAFRMMDNLVLISKDSQSSDPGRLVYYGAAYPEAVYFFNPTLNQHDNPTPDKILEGLKGKKTKDWIEQYNSSKQKKEYVIDRKGTKAPPSSTNIPPKFSRRLGLGQLITLVKRCFTIKLRDTASTLILFAQAPIIAVLITLVFGGDARKSITAENGLEVFSATSISLFLITISAIWLGCSNAAREIVGEWAIYHRERMVNLKIPSYVLSKFIILGSLCGFQCLLLLGIIYIGCGLQAAFIPMFGLLLLVSLVGLAFGLTISALAKTSEMAIVLVPLILIPMVVLGGAMYKVDKLEILPKFFSDFMASRWSYEGLLLMEAKKRDKWTPPCPTKTPTTTSQEKQTTANNVETSTEVRKADAQDMAENYFPTDERYGVGQCVIALLIMLGILTAATLSILRLRDIH